MPVQACCRTVNLVYWMIVELLVHSAIYQFTPLLSVHNTLMELLAFLYLKLHDSLWWLHPVTLPTASSEVKRPKAAAAKASAGSPREKKVRRHLWGRQSA